MLLNKLFQAIGIPMVVRNIMVDYCDCKGNFYHKPLQTISPPEYMESDADLTARIQEEMRQQGFLVCGIQEVFGDFEMEELEQVFNGSRSGFYSKRLIYIDMEKAVQ